MILVKETKEAQFEGLGKRIREARKKLRGKKTIDVICQEVGVSKTYWYDIENECLRGALSIENLRKIEQVLDVDLGINFKTPIVA
jgi:transcriptional regulator with XRE-family HTH domain